MRYALLVLTMAGDILLLIALYIVLSHHVVLGLILAVPTGYTWWKSGNVETWRPRDIKQYLRNAKRAGL